MKAPVSLCLFLCLSLACSAVDITTRTGQTFKAAEITKQDSSSVTVSYADGLATIPKEDLPAELQKQIGYVTKAEAATRAAEDAKSKAGAEAKDASAKAEADKQKKAALAAERALSPVGASKRFYGKTEAEIVDMFGSPVKVLTGNNPTDGNYRILVYEEAKGKNTMFTIWASDGKVTEGFFKGALISGPKGKSSAQLLEDFKRGQANRGQ